MKKRVRFCIAALILLALLASSCTEKSNSTRLVLLPQETEKAISS